MLSKLLHNKLLLLIVLLAFVLRLFTLWNTVLAGDFEVHWKVAGQIASGHNFPLVGPSASIQDSFHLGPFYYYTLALLYILSFGSYQFGIVWFSLINAVTVMLVYLTARIWLTQKHSLFTAALYATSFYSITIGGFPWNPYLLPPVLFGCIVLFHSIVKGNHKNIIWLFVLISMGLQLHGSFVFLLPVLLLPLVWQKIPVRFWLLGMLVMAVAFSTWLYAEKHCAFCQTTSLLQTLTKTTAENCSFAYWLQHHGQGERCFGYIRNSLFILKHFSLNLIGTQRLPLLVLPASLIGWWLATSYASSEKRLLVLWLVLPWLGYLVYSGNVYQHYFLLFLPLPYIFFGEAMKRIEQRWPGKYYIAAGYGLLCILNVALYIASLSEVRG